MKNSNKPIQLTEQDMQFLVKEALKSYIKENNIDEGIWDGMKTLGRSVGNKMADGAANVKNNFGSNMRAMGNKIGNATQNTMNKMGKAYNNVKNTYQTGSITGDAQKYISNATNALNSLLQADNKLVQMGQNSVIGNGSQRQAVMQALNVLKNINGRFGARQSAWSK